MSYKTFTRRIKALENAKFLALDKVTGGTDGTTTIVNVKDTAKKLTDY